VSLCLKFQPVNVLSSSHLVSRGLVAPSRSHCGIHQEVLWSSSAKFDDFPLVFFRLILVLRRLSFSSACLHYVVLPFFLKRQRIARTLDLSIGTAVVKGSSPTLVLAGLARMCTVCQVHILHCIFPFTPFTNVMRWRSSLRKLPPSRKFV
jgi:hypothetical protein